MSLERAIEDQRLMDQICRRRRDHAIERRALTVR